MEQKQRLLVKPNVQAIKPEQQLKSKVINQDNKPYGHSEKLDRN